MAWPALSRVPVPRMVEPSLKVTVPVGVPAPGLFAVTVAVNVTACPDSDGLAEEVTTVVVGRGRVGVVEAPAGTKVASTMYQLSGLPKVRLPSCGPSALDRMSSRSEAALPLCTSRTYGTLWLLPGVA